MLLTENHLDEWVRANSREAQEVIVELVWRLVAASSPRSKERRFPLGDSIGQHGPDGVLNVDLGYAPFVPDGRSFWEIGTSLDSGRKATSDYKDLTTQSPEDVRMESAFVFVTPLSGRRDWPHTWKADAQAEWIEHRRKRHDWREVHVIDGTKLVDWLRQFPSAEVWLADKMGLPIQELETPEQRWAVLETIGTPPPLVPRVFLEGRDAAAAKVKDVFAATALQLKIDTHFPEQVVDFVCALITSMDLEARVDAASRCLIVSGQTGWNEVVARRDSQILIAGFNLDEDSSLGTKLLEKARRAGHAVIYAGTPGGIPHPNRVALPNPKDYQLKSALEAAGYSDERARTLSQKSGGNLTSLLRLLQNLSLMPEWAEGTAAAELAIAQLIGAWDERSDADRRAVERISGKAYGEWIATIREIASRPGTPLGHRDGVWTCLARYEAWYTLGRRLFDEHLDNFHAAAVEVLTELDPKFELARGERYAAAIHGKVLTHSRNLRRGIAETLALLGSHPTALTSTSFGKAEATAVLAVRSLLETGNWIVWASVDDLLPFLAEAAPGEFLSRVEAALTMDPCPFDSLFSEEEPGIMGANYMSGLLWALETLAWEGEQLGRVVLILGDLAARDPGGNWGNRPEHSLATILLPWLPQTMASVAQRKAAVAALLGECPDVAWRLLLKLLRAVLSSSTGSRRPTWRDVIPGDQARGVTQHEYWQQIGMYASLAVLAAQEDLKKLTELVERLADLPVLARESVLTYLTSDQVRALPEEDRLPLWKQLVDVISKHRKFADADWAMPSPEVNRIREVADGLAPLSPTLRHRRLFSERESDLYEEVGDYDAQRAKLELRRDAAVREIHEGGGVDAILEFARATETPWRVGLACAAVATAEDEARILPRFLDTSDTSVARLAGGFVWGLFRIGGWAWVDNIAMSTWTETQAGQLFAYLPFRPETWERVALILGEADSVYWSRTTANPYDTDVGLDKAVNELIKHGRPYAAIRCLRKMQYDKRPIDSAQAAAALLGALHSSESHAADAHELVGIIKVLQGDQRMDPDLLFKIEWAYLPILDRYTKAAPKLLERRLADEANFFCEVIRLVYRADNAVTEEVASDDDKKAVATNAYRLLSRWRTPPGQCTDSEFNGDALRRWLDAVKTQCAATGHLDVAMMWVGHVLVYVPADLDGLWINSSAADVLNARDATHMREGFVTELFNSRGTYGFSEGQEELKLATRYRAKAEAVEQRGFHRLAGALRDLAASYERDAARDSSRSPFDT